MDFDFSQDQYLFQETVRDLLTQTRSMEALRSGTDDQDLWSRLAELGVFSLALPERVGGMGGGFTDLALIFEEFGRFLVPAEVAASIVGAAFVARHADEANLLRLAAQGKARIALALAEAGGSASDEITLRAMRSGDGWVVSGEKLLVAGEPDAAALLVALDLEGEGLRIVLVEQGRSGATLERSTTLDAVGRWSRLRLDALRLEPRDLLGDHAAAATLFDMAAAVSAMQMTGVCARALQESVSYVAERKQFDRVIGSFQAIKHRCADMAVAVESCRSAAYFAAWALDEAAPDERARAVSIAKSWCGDQARNVVNQSIQLHGGMGFTWELGLHFYLRRLKIEEALHGDANWHRERLMAETLRSFAAAVA